MFSFDLARAGSDITAAQGCAPTSVPPTWTGDASAACQGALDAVSPRVSMVGHLLDEARAALERVDDFGICPVRSDP